MLRLRAAYVHDPLTNPGLGSIMGVIELIFVWLDQLSLMERRSLKHEVDRMLGENKEDL